MDKLKSFILYLNFKSCFIVYFTIWGGLLSSFIFSQDSSNLKISLQKKELEQLYQFKESGDFLKLEKKTESYFNQSIDDRQKADISFLYAYANNQIIYGILLGQVKFSSSGKKTYNSLYKKTLKAYKKNNNEKDFYLYNEKILFSKIDSQNNNTFITEAIKKSIYIYHKKVIKNYNQASKLNLKKYFLINCLQVMKLYMYQQQYDKALKGADNIEKIIQKNFNIDNSSSFYGDFYLIKAKLFYLKKDYQKALIYIKSSLKINPEEKSSQRLLEKINNTSSKNSRFILPQFIPKEIAEVYFLLNQEN